MLFILFLVFVVTPIVELAVIVQVAGSTGVLNTIGLLVLVSVVGAWLVRREGLGILRRAQREAAAGRIPGREMIDGLLVLGAGALMLTPGFVTDAVGLALLFPPTRALVRAVATRRLTRSLASGGTVFTYGWRGETMSGSGVLDADSWEDGPPGRPDEPRQLDD
ncbi:MAG: FxsA family protein [Acidimicrobiales bacterium]|nr:FxsA family protein [Acidimicrobiales bacterium]